MTHRHILIPLLFFWALQATAQTGVLQATVDRKSILIGEPIQLTLETEVPRSTTIQWLFIDTIPHFEIMHRSKIDSQVNGNNLQLRQHITLTSWDSGQWLIPSFSLPQYKQRRTPAIRIAVTHTPMRPDQPYNDIKDIIQVQKPSKISWYWYVAGAVLLLVLFFLLFPKRKREPTETLSGTDVYKRALAHLEQLQKENSMDVKIFYTELIGIFRTYVHDRKGIQSLHKTTDDLSRQLKELPLPAEQYNELVQVLQLSDAVKFARFVPTRTENEDSLNTIRKSIIAIENLS